MNRKARACIEAHSMISRGDRLVVGLSGGADSVALLHFLHSLDREWKLSLMAVHLNHNLRGEESVRDEDFVRELCARLGVELAVHSAAIAELAWKQRRGVEECAREERYLLFARHAGESGKICTAHTLSDSAETLLLNLTRGTALRGLCGIPPVRGNIIRPLITCTRQEIEAYCDENHLDYVTDSTNASDRYTRNRLRHGVVPVLREINPRVVELMGATIEALREDADYLDMLADAALPHLVLGDGRIASASPTQYAAAELLALPRPVCARVLLRLLADHDVSPHRRRLELLFQLLETGGGVQLSHRWLCRCKNGELEFFPTTKPSPQLFLPVDWQPTMKREIIPIFPGKSLCVFGLDYEDYKHIIKNNEKVLKNALDYDRIGKIVKFRPRLPGDTIRLAGRGCTKTLKKLYNEAALTGSQRESTVVLASEDRLLWVEGFGVAEAAGVRQDTRRVLIVEVLEDAVCTRI